MSFVQLNINSANKTGPVCLHVKDHVTDGIFYWK